MEENNPIGVLDERRGELEQNLKEAQDALREFNEM